VYKWYKYKYQHAKNVKEKAYYTYKSAAFLLNQLQVDRLDSTPFYFAKHKVDTQFNTDFTSFMIVYLKSKYANQVLNAQDETIIHQFFKPFEQKIKSHYKFTQRISRFLNLNQFVRFYHLSEPPKNN
jgi:NAD+--asparagine ADP-ribosyltransferase